MAVDILNLSDEELLNLNLDELEKQQISSTQNSADGEGQGNAEVLTVADGQSTGGDAAGQADQTQTNQNQDNASTGDDGANGADGAGDDTQSTSAASGLEGKDAAASVDATDTGSDKAGNDQGANSDTPQNLKPTETAEQSNTSVDYKSEYEKLLAPFPANGKDMQVRNVDEAITLMQMGANYHKKMAALKPNLKLLKILEKNDLLSEEKISFLIDLDKKNPDAINKLIADSKLDPMDLDADKAGAYKPTTRTVDDKELELDSVLEEIQDTTSYKRTIGIVGQEWDQESKAVVANNPQLLKVVNEHVKSGIYDVIKAEVDRERALGRLLSVPDIEAYRQVGDAINARGGFAHLSAKGQQTTHTQQQVVVPAPKKVDDQKLNDKRRAAAPAKPAATASKPAPDFNPLALSDEEFQKLVKPNFL